MKWHSVEKKLPKCNPKRFSIGVPVLIWPRDQKDVAAHGGVAYFGRRVTGSPAFYIYGTVLPRVTHWMELPKGPSARSARKHQP